MKNSIVSFISRMFAVLVSAMFLNWTDVNANELVVTPLSPAEWQSFQTMHNNGPDDVGAFWFGMAATANGGTLAATRGHMYDYMFSQPNAINFVPGETHAHFTFSGNNPQNAEFGFTGLGVATSFPGLPDGGVMPNAIVLDIKSVAGLNLSAMIGNNPIGTGVYLIHQEDWSNLGSLHVMFDSDSNFAGDLTGSGVDFGMYANIQAVPEPAGLAGGTLLLALIALRRKHKRKLLH